MYKSDKEEEDRILAKWHRSQRNNDHPHSINLDITPRSLYLAHWSWTVGYVKWKIEYFCLQPAMVADHIFFFMASGSCSHIIGLLMALPHWILIGFKAVPDNLTCTSLPQQRSVPRGSKIESAVAPPPKKKKIAFFKPHPERRQKSVENVLTKCK